MVTRRVNGPFYLICRFCGKKHGPFVRASGSFRCAQCNRVSSV